MYIVRSCLESFRKLHRSGQSCFWHTIYSFNWWLRIPSFIHSFTHQIFTELESFRPFPTQVFLPTQEARPRMPACCISDLGGKEGSPCVLSWLSAIQQAPAQKAAIGPSGDNFNAGSQLHSQKTAHALVYRCLSMLSWWILGGSCSRKQSFSLA